MVTTQPPVALKMEKFGYLLKAFRFLQVARRLKAFGLEVLARQHEDHHVRDGTQIGNEHVLLAVH